MGRPPLTLSVCCSSPATMAVRHFRHDRGDDALDILGRVFAASSATRAVDRAACPGRSRGGAMVGQTHQCVRR